jgi:hypothetical protein
VRTQREPVQHAIRRHTLEIVRQPIEIDERAGRFQLIEELRRGRARQGHHECRMQNAECRMQKCLHVNIGHAGQGSVELRLSQFSHSAFCILH